MIPTQRQDGPATCPTCGGPADRTIRSKAHDVDRITHTPSALDRLAKWCEANNGDIIIEPDDGTFRVTAAGDVDEFTDWRKATAPTIEAAAEALLNHLLGLHP